MNSNLGNIERLTRHVFGFGLIIAVLTLPQVPAWLALLAIYPLFTAILKWDPFYEVYLTTRQKSAKGFVPAGGSYDVPV
jgi:hypothetical protein